MRLTLLALLAASTSAFAQSRVDVLEGEVLLALDRPGQYSLATILNVAPAEAAQRAAKLPQLRLNEFVKQSPNHFGEIAKTIGTDIEEIIRQSGERVAYSSEIAETMAKDGKVPRHFDPFWLSSRDAAMPLVAVVNRIDRRDFNADTCGEVRFIYRFAYYRANPVESISNMPLLLNVVFDYPRDAKGNCQEIALKWTGLPPAEQATALAEALSKGALNKSLIKLKQIELNMQALRYPSELKFDFGGQAIYLLRIFQEEGGKLRPIALENTINVAEIEKDPSLKKNLLEQISSGLQKIDEGTFKLENTGGKLLATRALSFTTLGRGRVANKPFTAVFGAEAEDFKNLDLKGRRFLKSPRGLTERLNGMTCIGCHQTGGTAGFHMLGRTYEFNNVFNQVLLPFSSHYGAERTRRAKYTQALSEAKKPETFRPPSFFPPVKNLDSEGRPVFEDVKIRDLCLKPDQISYTNAMKCEAGTKCVMTVKNSDASIQIGECVADRNDTPGNVCREGVMKSEPMRTGLGDLYNLFAIRDTLDFDKLIGAPGARCTKPDQGVPLGRIPQRCVPDSAEGRLEFVDGMTKASQAPKAFCVVQGGQAFDDCAKSANPPACLETAEIARALLDSCSYGRYCREDYICQQLPDVSRQYTGRVKDQVKARVKKLAELGVGFCVPNYFIFNMRADGHILPEGRVR